MRLCWVPNLWWQPDTLQMTTRAFAAGQHLLIDVGAAGSCLVSSLLRMGITHVFLGWHKLAGGETGRSWRHALSTGKWRRPVPPRRS